MADKKYLTDKETEELFDCEKLNTRNSFDEKAHKGELSIEDLLQQNKFEAHLGSFELPETIKDIMTIDEVNAIVTWYLSWKIYCPIAEQTTCTIINVFGYADGTKAIVAINFFKYLRNKSYDPAIVEVFEKNRNMHNLHK